MAIYFYNLFNRVIKIQADALYSLIQSPHLAGAPKQQKRKYMHYKHPLYGLKVARKEESQAREKANAFDCKSKPRQIIELKFCSRLAQKTKHPS